MSVVSEMEILQNSKLTALLREMQVDISKFRGAEFAPFVPVPVDEIKWQRTYGAAGLTPAVGAGNESPVYGKMKISQQTFEAARWREKSILDEDDLRILSREVPAAASVPGQDYEMYKERLVIERLEALNVRLETRIEQMRWATLLDTMVVTIDGVDYAVNYGVPDNRKVNPVYAWTDYDNADIIRDIDTWNLLYRNTPFSLKNFWTNEVTKKYIKYNKKLLDLIKYQFGNSWINDEMFKTVLNGKELVTYDGSYQDDLGVWQQFIPDGIFILMPNVAAGEKFIEVLSTNQLYTDMNNPQPGKFAKRKDMSDDDPPRIELIAGFYGLGAHYAPSSAVIATVTTGQQAAPGGGTTRVVEVTVGDNGTSEQEGTNVYNDGDDVLIIFTPDEGYQIASVTLDGEAVADPSSVLRIDDIDADHTVAVTFSLKTYTIAASCDENGTITPSGNRTVNHGGSVAFAITAATGYAIHDVLVDGVSVGAVSTYTFTNVTSAHTIDVEILAEHTITATAGANGSITPAGSVKVFDGHDQKFVITPDAEYEVDTLTVDGVAAEVDIIEGEISYTFEAVSDDHAIEVTFKLST